MWYTCVGGPYMNSISEFNKVEANMRMRRKEIQGAMGAPKDSVFSMSTFPRLGCKGRNTSCNMFHEN